MNHKRRTILLLSSDEHLSRPYPLRPRHRQPVRDATAPGNHRRRDGAAIR